MVIFGVLAVTAGLTILWLPETLNSNMCQTLEETNLAKEYYGFIWMEKHVMNPFSFLRWDNYNILINVLKLRNHRCFNTAE